MVLACCEDVKLKTDFALVDYICVCVCACLPDLASARAEPYFYLHPAKTSLSQRASCATGCLTHVFFVVGVSLVWVMSVATLSELRL